MKNLSLKAKKLEEPSRENEESDDEEDPFTLIARGLEGIMKMRKKIQNIKVKVQLQR